MLICENSYIRDSVSKNLDDSVQHGVGKSHKYMKSYFGLILKKPCRHFTNEIQMTLVKARIKKKINVGLYKFQS